MAAIGVIDYGMGNLHSLAKALERVADGKRVEVSPDPERLAKCERLVLPGVGGVRACMDELHRLELDGLVREQAARVPLLGVCLGMQIFLDHSQENGGTEALGLIPGEVLRFPDPAPDAPERLKVPHMGWNRVHQAHPHPLWEGIDDDEWFYFVHSYYALPSDAAHLAGESEYGRRFAAAVARDNLFAVQFHPEKSQSAGLRLLANFCAWDGRAG
jgi:imidazole glycerol phosphate synthase subunit hisH (EC 2.4.2.-)